MKRLLLSGLLSLTLLPRAGLATDQFYINNGSVTVAPVIDAINFVNNGSFSVFTTLPFDTSNTRNFTNNGTMSGALGYRFDTASSTTGLRKPAANFVNRLSGIVDVQDVISGQILVGGPQGPLITLLQGGTLSVSATNIVNDGLLAVGAAGQLNLSGNKINLKRSGIEVNPIVGFGSFNNDPGPPRQFQPDVAIYDNYWAQSNLTFNSSQLLSPFFVGSPIFPINGGGSDQISLSGSIFADFYTNDIGVTTVTVTNIDGSTLDVSFATNSIRQGVFVGVSDPNFTVSIGFTPSTNPTNRYQTAALLLEFASSNNVSAQLEFTDLYFSDTLASERFRGLLPNLTGSGTFRPANYLLSRLNFGVGAPGNDPFADFNFFVDSTFTNPIVNSEYAAYSALIDHVTSRPPPIPAGTVSNIPGRITIKADSLDMTKTRVRGEGLIDIQANHLIGSSGASVDGESLSFSVGSTNGNLTFQNLAALTTVRLQGNVRAWTGVWTNFSTIVTTNFTIVSNVPTFTPLTNIATVRFQCLIFDAGILTTVQPVSVYDFITHTTNLTVNDAMTIVQSLNIDARNLTINGSIALSGAVLDWDHLNTPNLRNFTNNGTITIPNNAHFGDDLATPLVAFVNRGVMSAFSQTINSDYAEIAGTHSASGPFSLITRSGKIENGTVSAAGDVTLSGAVLKLNNGSVSSGSRLDLNITSNLFDLGGASGNALSCRDGFRLLVKPTGGDLLGTAIQSSAPIFAEVDHTWAGVDRGATTAGYSNNVALGQLALVPEGSDPLFVFSGAGTGNGLYVDLLDLSQLTDYQNQLEIDPNIVIYFAAAQLAFTPPLLNGVPQLPEEFLDGQFGGHLRWVRDFAGPNSSVDVILNGTQTIKVNRALRNSKIIDSDGDGTPNFFDFTPFDSPAFVLKGAMVKTNQPPASAFRVSWLAVPAMAYQVEFTTNMPLSNWQPLLKYTNTAPTNQTVTIWDTNVPAGALRRFYRVGYSP